MIDHDELVALERRVGDALARDDDSGLRVLGYGEITVVLGWPADDPAHACKRLPVFATRAAFDAYATVHREYLEHLDACGVRVVPTMLHALEQPGGTVIGYCVQPILPAETLLPNVLRAHDPSAGHPAFAAIVDAVLAATGPRVGLDAQVANWAWHDGALSYFDVTTPMQLDVAGRPLLDLGVFLAPFPWPLRAPIRRFVLPDVLARFTRPRDVLVDLAGNLLKERLDDWLPTALVAANAQVAPPITEPEVRRFYAQDARLWAAMLRLRRIDRAWQRRVRRRPYPFLLPGRIER
ncbi:MAG TPA: DUF6206 family protein [Acidimicrobiia bacterium]|nr:DUF6206 family protein [Acidimicrobiia bacterium]